MLELTEVEAKLDANGQCRPLAFVYHRRRVDIGSYGRRWVREGFEHFLVMDHNRKVYELAYDGSEKRWFLIRTPDSYGPHRPSAV